MAEVRHAPLRKATQSPAGVWVVQLPFSKPRSLNDRNGFWADAKSKKEWREGTCEAVLAVGIPHCERIKATLFYTPNARRRRDPDNLVASYKPVVDALVDAGVIDDDTQEYVERMWPWINEPVRVKPEGRFLLVVEQLA